METRQLKISEEADRQLHAAARHWGLSKKCFAEEAILFFASHHISPKGYCPGLAFDQLQLIRTSTNRIISVFQQQEREVFSGLMTEMLRNQVAVQALMNLLVDYLVEPAEQAAVSGRLQDYIEQHMALLDQRLPVQSAISPEHKGEGG